jgi:hypothetical protein
LRSKISANNFSLNVRLRFVRVNSVRKFHTGTKESEYKMTTKMKTTLALAGLLTLGTAALVVKAQDAGGPQNGGGPGGQNPRGHRPPAPAIIRALDANHDGVIDADEIANAVAVLKSLDKNGDGKLTPDEFDGRPRPQHRGNQDGGDMMQPPPDGGDFGGPPGPPPNDQ